MKLEISSQKLKEIIHLVERLAGKQTTLPVLSCILINVKNGNVVLKTTNLDIGIEISLPVKSEKDGVIAVPARTFSSFISQIPEQNQIIYMEEISGNLKISSSHSKGVIKTVPNEDFPTIPRVLDGQNCVVQSKLFSKGLSSVSYSASISGVTPELSSVYVYKNNEDLVFVATDSFRLAEKIIKINTPTSFGDMMIPLNNVLNITKILESMSEKVSVTSNKNLISFESGGIYLVSRLIDGVFPDYRQIVPKEFITEAVVLKQDLINALKVANIFSDKFNQVRFIIKPTAKTFEIFTKNSDVGENQTSLPASLSGEPAEINFNHKYMTDCFQSVESDSVSLRVSGNNRPMIIRPVSGDQTFMYLVMPMNR